ncbi:MAG: hypothetical protein ACI9J3_003647 [Parvicellaceae bacterium]|jgi:hypothetical protein
MKKLILSTVILVMAVSSISCVTKKDTPEKEDIFEVVPMMNSTNYITGTVTDEYAKDGCKFLIKVMGKGAEQLINPVNLPDKYKKDGMKISFMWTASKAPQLDNCKMGIWAHLDVEPK